ncbi:hypothetical protein M1N59_01940 [Dehalococcoidales bacterium]|nr:hypothetical protein [Dehalococcoidales bacterium]
MFIKDAGKHIEGTICYALTELKLGQVLKIPVHLHCHFTSGMTSMAYLKAIEAGIGFCSVCLTHRSPSNRVQVVPRWSPQGLDLQDGSD